MNGMDAVDLVRQAMMTTLLMVAPVLVMALLVGIVTSMLQAITQLQDQSISFVPKLLAVGATLLFCMPWMTEFFVQYAREIIRNIPVVVAGG